MGKLSDSRRSWFFHFGEPRVAVHLNIGGLQPRPVKAMYGVSIGWRFFGCLRMVDPERDIPVTDTAKGEG